MRLNRKLGRQSVTPKPNKRLRRCQNLCDGRRFAISLAKSDQRCRRKIAEVNRPDRSSSWISGDLSKSFCILANKMSTSIGGVSKSRLESSAEHPSWLDTAE